MAVAAGVVLEQRRDPQHRRALLGRGRPRVAAGGVAHQHLGGGHGGRGGEGRGPLSGEWGRRNLLKQGSQHQATQTQPRVGGGPCHAPLCMGAPSPLTSASSICPLRSVQPHPTSEVRPDAPGGERRGSHAVLATCRSYPLHGHSKRPQCSRSKRTQGPQVSPLPVTYGPAAPAMGTPRRALAPPPRPWAPAKRPERLHPPIAGNSRR